VHLLATFHQWQLESPCHRANWHIKWVTAIHVFLQTPTHRFQHGLQCNMRV